MKHLLVLLVAILAGGAFGCTTQQHNSGNTSSQATPRTQTRSTPLNSTPGHDHAAESAVPRINVTEAQAAIDRGEAVFLDVRQRPAYQSGHIKDAISMPESEIAARAGTLPKDKKIITYCS